MAVTNLVAGILAHVDAGKTTLAESILFETGQIRKVGRVDHQDAFLDTYALEKERGITIFSKQAQITFTDDKGQEHSMTLLDTPGHVDFSAEMERTLQVLDYAILVISGSEGVQSHVQTLWKLLERYEIPTFLFVNKMDQPGTDRDTLMEELRKRLDERCVDFTPSPAFAENAAMCSETLLNQFLESGTLGVEELTQAIRQREMFPCCFGSALKMEGVKEFLDVFFSHTSPTVYPKEFGARVYKIGRDKQGKRLTYLKITGGEIRAKMELPEKVDQIRIYSGAGFVTVPEAKAGTICAVTGLNETHIGEGLGIEEESMLPVLEPVLTYQVLLEEGQDIRKAYLQLAKLMEEEPQLHLVWNEELQEIHVQVMGAVQMEILKRLAKERCDLDISFGAGSIVYKETIQSIAEGVGHFEPLGHYAEVHLLLEPGEPGSGLQFEADCSTDVLAKNWQRLVLTHLEERIHRGVLAGAEITDMKITLIAGKAHLKHTEGGDFRQATYRALRQGLMVADSVLLEPVYEFTLEVPTAMIGRALSDMERMHARFEAPQTEGEKSLLTGFVPASEVQNYSMELAAYSGGLGQLTCTLSGYEPCHNAEEVLLDKGYDPEADLGNPTGSVFCAHGAGYVVDWDAVYEHCHIPVGAYLPERIKRKLTQTLGGQAECLWEDKEEALTKELRRQASKKAETGKAVDPYVTEEELKTIFERTYGSGREERGRYKKSRAKEVSFTERGASYPGSQRTTGWTKKGTGAEEYLLVDGYNILFSWPELRELLEKNPESARTKLMDILCNYQGYRKCTLILVFDAYRVEGNPGGVVAYHNIHVVYTKEAETADQYIEKTVHRLGKNHKVTVATSDALEQIIIWGQGAKRLSAQGLAEEIQLVEEELRREHLSKTESAHNYLFDYLSEELAERMEKIRLGEEE